MIARTSLDWLIARPIAHRGLHDAGAGIVENSPSAFAAAVAANYAIECDLQLSADGEAMVHHDDALGRLNDGSDRLDTVMAAELKRTAYRGSADCMIALGDLCDLVAGRITLVLELKSRFNNDLRLVTRAARVLGGYPGPVALMSFDPNPIKALRALAPKLTRGIVAQRHHAHAEGAALPFFGKRTMADLAHAPQTAPQFIAYSVADLPGLVPYTARTIFHLPLLTWTVRSEDDRRRAARYADQMIFEGFRP
jgi:glycerophosphoryl diester phosphodiesterase